MHTGFNTGVLVALALSATPHAAADELSFTPEVQLRSRAEADTGRDGAAGTGDVAFVTQRSRLGGSFTYGEAIEARVVVSDVRTWGEEAHTRRDYDADGLDVRIAVLQWQATPTLSLRIGRDEVPLHEERLLARANWRQPGRSFDGVQLLGSGQGWAAAGRWFLLTEGDTTDFAATDQAKPDGGDQWIFYGNGGLHTERALAEGVAVVEGDSDAQRLRSTTGVFAKGERGDLSGRAEAYAQLGTLGEQRYRAGLVGVEGLWHGRGARRATAGLAYDLLTGDPDPADDVLGTFNTLYGANHRYYGLIDIAYFKQGGGADGRGLQDLALKGGLSPVEALSLAAEAHAFAGAPGVSPALFASELDLSARYRFAKPLQLSLGASAYLPVDGGATDPDLWAWLMLDLKL